MTLKTRYSFRVKVLVTGGAGFIGSEFVRLLLGGASGFEDIKKLVVSDLEKQ